MKHVALTAFFLLAVLALLVVGKGCDEFNRTWERTERQKTLQAIIINSEPKTYKGMKDSLFNQFIKDNYAQ